MSTAKAPLRYLFYVMYTDGTMYKQQPDDRAIMHEGDEDWWPSSFRDVDLDHVAMFFLTDGETEAGVVLRNIAETPNSLRGVNRTEFEPGSFIIGGTSFTMHDQNHQLQNFKLVYFREMRQESVDGVVGAPYVHKFYLGYEATDIVTGKKVKRVMGLAA
jgi:hypothetical protein